eukprot:TRINITY_DN2374_c0_g1_i14.p1 TRINITY_DN2374_c0_g1~~TRINITY_DN2374_c0_g1_i14.p1  ORF type:complete len:252 (-),score=22.65 TRINITY_DN2374_c0_g1_i14:156-911(-)
MSYFYFAYLGNKRNEADIILSYVDMKKYDTIVEPLCGSFALSIYCYDTLKLDYNYVLNDIDPNLCDFLKDVKINGSDKYFKFCQKNLVGLTKKKFNNIIKKREENLLNWFFYRKVFGIGCGRFPNQKLRALKLKKHFVTDKFLNRKNTIIYNKDYTDILNMYKDKPNVLIYLDPPYVNSYNARYRNKNNGTDETYYLVEIKKFMEKAKCKVLLSINSNELIKYFFKEFNIQEYDKKYSHSKGIVKHLLISN